MDNISDIDLKIKNLLDEEKKLKNTVVYKRIQNIEVEKENLINEKQNLIFSKYDNCEHIWAYFNEKQCGCIKCGLDKRVLTENISTKEERLMRKYLLSNINVFNSGLNVKLGHPYKKARSLYNLAKSKHPMLEDNRIVELINKSPVVDVKAEARKKLKKL